jgi:ketosteroid isomerase-like protein
MKRIILFFAPTIMIFAACSNQSASSNASAIKDSTATNTFDLAAAKNAINEGDKTFSEAIIKGDSVTAANLYASDANMFPPNMPKAENQQQIMNVLGAFARMGIKSFNLESTNVFGGPEYVIEEGKYTIGDGKGKNMDEGKFVVVWKQEDGKWKLYRDIWNSNMPAQPASK